MLTQCKHQQTLSSLFSSAQLSWLQHPNRSSEQLIQVLPLMQPYYFKQLTASAYYALYEILQL